MDQEFERAGHAAEVRIMASVAPHWPTYHRMMGLCRKAGELFDALRFRDVGDIIASKSAPDEIGRLLVELNMGEDSFAADVWETVLSTRSISDKQSKVLAMAAAKAATIAGRWGLFSEHQ